MSGFSEFILFTFIGAIVFGGLSVLLYCGSSLLAKTGIVIESRTRLSQQHFFITGMLIALVAVPMQFLVGWRIFVVLAILAVVITGMGEHRVAVRHQ